MIYPDSFEQKLNFDKIRKLLAGCCLSTLGQERVSDMHCSFNFGEVEIQLKQLTELLRLEQYESDLPITYVIDVREPLKRIKVEGLYLEEEELFDLRRSLGTIKDIVYFLNSKDPEFYPELIKLSSAVKVYPTVLDRIDSILTRQGKIKDNASPELKRLRNGILLKQQSASRRMAEIMRRMQKEGWVDADVSVSIRDGRAVIPVPSANKRKVPGIIHDESATGKTTYIEPSAIVEINNEIREMSYAEKREVIKILIDISSFIRPYLYDILESFDFLAEIDFIRAKIRFAKEIKAVIPEIKNRPSFSWIDAIHPILFIHFEPQGKKVVPLSLSLTPEERIVLISGPNAGGKSVCLQTVALIQYMIQCGLPVPVKGGSLMGFFNDIFLDLGDEQSIENDLSTYSSHLLNMKSFLKFCNDRSLILIDEFGTGTEPMLGGAIAEAVLETLNENKVYGIITTHYTNLKHYASQTDGIVNGAMQFDTHLLQPLFKLEVGSPGSSFAFEIARKIGLPESILELAKDRLGEDHINFDRHLREIIRDKRYWSNKRRMIREKERKMDSVLSKYKGELEVLLNERREIIQKAKKEAENILAGANQKIEKTIRVIREAQAEKERTREARNVLETFHSDISEKGGAYDVTQRKLANKMEKLVKREQRKKKSASREQTPKDKSKESLPVIDKIGEGDLVTLKGQPVTGEVLELSDKEALVAFGQMITKVKVTRLQKVSRKEYKKSLREDSQLGSGLAERIRKKKLNFKPDIDIRGMRVDEAIDRVAIHLDEAVLCGYNKVKILHGKGTGALRTVIREYLGTIPFVKKVSDEHVQFGGSGITVVDLD